MSDNNIPPDFYLGSPVDPPDLWFREQFIQEIWEVLKQEHVLITAPRRTGKTSVMDHLAAYPEQGFLTVKVFVQHLDHPKDFILTLIDAFHDLDSKLFRSIFKSSSKIFQEVVNRIQEIDVVGFKVALREQEPDWARKWLEHGDTFLNHLHQSNNPILFIVDEFPDFILKMHRLHGDQVDPFLAWFRKHRLNPHPKQDPVKWLLAGSVNLSSTLDSMGCLDLINDIQEMPLPELSLTHVAQFISRMLKGRGVHLQEGFEQAAAERIGCPIPLFLQMITQDLFRIWKQNPGNTLTVSDLDKVYQKLLTDSAARDKLQHYYSRIQQYYDEPKRSAAYEILSQLSVCEDGLDRRRIQEEFDRVLLELGHQLPVHERKRLCNQLLRDLENDFYIGEKPQGSWTFAISLLKDWWKKYYA